MRTIFAVCLPAICAALAGCGTCSTGYYAGILRPPTVQSNAIVSQQQGAIQVAPFAAYPAEPAGRPGAVLGYVAEAETIRTRPQLAATSSCTMTDLCNGLDRIERLLIKQATLKSMPSAPNE
jgi:hypothetical protein